MADPEKFIASPPQEPTVYKGMPKAGSLLTTADLDAIIARGGARTPGFTVAKRSKPAPNTEYTLVRYTQEADIRELADPLGVAEYLQSGYSLKLGNLQHFDERLGRFTERLGYELGSPIKAFAFFTPPGNQALGQHYDQASNFLCQCEGKKLWRLYRPVMTNPLERHAWSWANLTEEDRSRLNDGPPDIEVLLEEGDVLWMPRGWIHAGVTESDRSLHVSLRVETSTESWMAQSAVDWLADRRGLRLDLPIGFASSPEDCADTLRDVFAKMTDSLTDDDLTDLAKYVRAAHFRRFMGPRIKPFDDVLRGKDAEIGDVRIRPEGAVGQHWEDGSLRVHLGTSERVFDEPAASLVAELLTEEHESLLETAQKRLGSAQGELLVRQLLASGLAVRSDEAC
ncbi:JmjC domain-containing protein [Streptomyces sp. NPDC050485]|uniref:JmjC domain-containing protein n=1 Tax=Streptomyces sp. NPDC050485 TaxID=3365617 RepID=UPI0037B81B93